MTALTDYKQLPSGFWVRDDGSGPYFVDVSTGDVVPVGSPRNRLHSDIRALLNDENTYCSIHNASGVVSNGPGQLFGFMVLNPGTAPTLSAYDNPSAATGFIRKTTVSGEWAAAAWLYCGPDGAECDNGIYLSLGGGAAPVVLAVFQGSRPTVTHSGTEMWFDGTNGSDSNNGLSISAPRKTLSRSSGELDSGNWRLYFKRGTVVNVPVTATQDMTGTDILVQDYGDTSLAKPIINFLEPSSPESFTITNAGSGYTNGVHTGLAAVGGSGTGLLLTITVTGGVVTACTRHTRGSGYAMGDVITCSTIPGGGSGFACTPLTIGCGTFSSIATSGVCEWRDVDVRYTGSINNTGTSAVVCQRGATLLASGVDVWATGAGKFNNGFMFGANSTSRMVDCRVLRNLVTDGYSVGTAFYGGTSVAACASYALIHRCTVEKNAASADACTMHDGNAMGTCNAVVGGQMDAGTENCIDILGGYDRTLIFGVTGEQGNSYAIAVDNGPGSGGGTGGAGVMIVASDFRHGTVDYGMSLIRQASPIVSGNYIEGLIGGSGGLLGLESTCTNSLIQNNTLWSLAGDDGPLIWVSVNGAAGSSGILRNNLCMDDCTDPASSHTFRCFNAANFAAWTIESNYWRAPSPRWYDGSTVFTTFAGWNGTAANDIGWSATEPVLTDDYVLPEGSPLIHAGYSLVPVCYMGLTGVFWQYGQPSVGAAEPWQ